MDRRFDAVGGGREDAELAMAATLFAELQAAGYIPWQADPADNLPGERGPGARSYESALLAMIRDQDSDGRLDVDLDALRSEGILSQDVDTVVLERELTHDLRAELNEDFVMRNRWDSRLGGRGRRAEARRETVLAHARDMRFEGSQAQTQQAYLDGVPSLARRGPDAAREVATEVVEGAQRLDAIGDAGNALTLLTEGGAALLDAGAGDAAAHVFRALKRNPHAGGERSLLQGVTALAASTEGVVSDGYVSVSRGGTVTNISATHTTYRDLAQHRLRQIEVRGRMEAALGRDVNPLDMDDAEAYFQAFSATRGTDAVRAEYEGYLQAFFVHPGVGVTWSEAIAQDERPARMSELLEGAVADDAGRTFLDCEGFTYLTDRILGAVQTEAGDQRFEVSYAGHPGHVIAAVFDRESEQAFSVNNEDAAMLAGDLSNTEHRRNEIARALCGGRSRYVAFGERPSQARPSGAGGVPDVGAQFYDGTELTYFVTEYRRTEIMRELQ